MRPTYPLGYAGCLAFCFAMLSAGCDTPATYAPATGAASPIDVPAERPTFTVGDEFWFDTGGGAIFVEVFVGAEDGLLPFDRVLRDEVLYYSPDLALVEVRRPFGADQWFDPDDGALDS